MTKKAESESRRRLLKQLAAGGGVAITAKGLPEGWTKPVVNSVLLPAHAETSECQCSPIWAVEMTVGLGGGGAVSPADASNYPIPSLNSLEIALCGLCADSVASLRIYNLGSPPGGEPTLIHEDDQPSTTSQGACREWDSKGSQDSAFGDREIVRVELCHDCGGGCLARHFLFERG